MITKEDIGRKFKTYRGDVYKISYIENLFSDGDWVVLEKHKSPSRGIMMKDFLSFFKYNKCKWLN